MGGLVLPSFRRSSHSGAVWVAGSTYCTLHGLGPGLFPGDRVSTVLTDLTDCGSLDLFFATGRTDSLDWPHWAALLFLGVAAGLLTSWCLLPACLEGLRLELQLTQIVSFHILWKHLRSEGQLGMRQCCSTVPFTQEVH